MPRSRAKGEAIFVDGREIRVCSVKDPAALPWGEMGVDIVVESTGIFRDKLTSSKHLQAGAKKVVITAPAKDPDITVVLGVNEQKYDPMRHELVSERLVHHQLPRDGGQGPARQLRHPPRLRVHRPLLHERSAHPRLPPQGSPPRARRRGEHDPDDHGSRHRGRSRPARAQGQLDGIAIRVPTANVSVVDLTVELGKPASPAAINDAFRAAAAGPLKGILDATDEELVSVDFNGNPHSSIVDLPSTAIVDGNLVKVLAWYDNEWGYSCRVRDLIRYMARSL